MDELPPPDLHDHRGRFHRILWSLAAGFAFAAIGWYVAYTLIGAGTDYEHGDRAARRFVFLIAGAAFVGAYRLVFVLLVRRDKRRWDEAQFPKAQIR